MYLAKFSGKTVSIKLTRSARQALARRDTPIQAEMELYFSCLIRKRVIFTDVSSDSSAERVEDNLYVQFRPVMTRHCSLDTTGAEPPLTDFHIVDLAPFVPKWLTIDYRRGKWLGEFGY